MSRWRRVQLFLVMFLMLLGALAELATLGAVLPFLALISDPERAGAYPAFQFAFTFLGWEDKSQILLPATLLFATVALGAGFIRVLLAWASNKFVFGLGHDLGIDVYRRTLFQPYSYHVTHNTSEMVAATNTVQMVTAFMLLPLLQAVIAATITAFVLGALIAIDPLLALGSALVFGLIYLAVMGITRARLRANSGIIARTQPELVKAVQEGLGGIRDVLINNAQRVYLDKFESVSSDLRWAQATNTFIGAAPRFVIEAIGIVLIAFLALFLSTQDGGLTAALPVLGALAIGAQRIMPLLQQIYVASTMIRGSRDMLLDITEFLALPIPAEHLTDKRAQFLPFEREIVLENLTFCYGKDRPAVLNDLDLVIQKGDRVGFIGKSGSGKSTVGDLIMGLLEPTSGTIRIDGRILDRASRLAWQAHIAHVPQTIFLSDTTVAENIAFSVPLEAIDFDRVREAAHMAEIASFIESLPDGYLARVGERGVQLSGGQRQRIGIARALYRRADVLVFDEATSALDGETEADVLRAIAALGRDLTVLIIAHRLSTVAHCDHIVRMEAGQIVSEGTYERIVLAGIANDSTASDALEREAELKEHHPDPS